MNCTTVKEGKECPFMTRKGCSFNGGICHEIVESCKGCSRTIEYNTGWYCMAFPDPAIKWKTGPCNMASHVGAAATAAAQKKVNPMKASKRKGR